MDDLTQAELGYLAGLVDGEGCINIACTRGRYYVLQVITAQTNEYMLNHWQQRTGLGTVHRMKSSSNPNQSNKWHWHCSNKKAEQLLRPLMPYLVLKQEEARVALEFLGVCRQQQAQFRGKHVARLTDEMLKVREVYKQTLHDLKKQRAGAELERPLEVEYTIPTPRQLRLLEPRPVWRNTWKW